MALPQHSNHNDNEKSEVRKVIEDRVKRQIRKKGLKVARKALKHGAKLAGKALLKLGPLLLKVLSVIFGAISLKILLIIAFVLLVIVIVVLMSALIFGTGNGIDTSEEQELRNYIVEQANATVNMNDSIQVRYRVPEELIAAVIQIDALTDYDEKAVIRNMATSLAPEFLYDDFNEWRETRTQVCTDGVCEPWSDITREDIWVSKLTDVDFWNGYTQFTYTPFTTPWSTHIDTTIEIEEYDVIETILVPTPIEVPYRSFEPRPYIELVPTQIAQPLPHFPYYRMVTIEVPVERCCQYVEVIRTRTEMIQVQEEVTVTKTREKIIEHKTQTRRQRFTTSEDTTTDYSTFDQILNSYNFGLNDKKLVEATYEFIGGTINFSEWLSGFGGIGFGYGGFNGTIVPGGGVPAEFMEYYLSAEARFGVDWFTLAAVHYIETKFSTHQPMISSAGAIGHMQFLPATWVGWTYNIGGGRVPSSIDLTSLSVIATGRGYGVDGNGDGKADPWNIADAIHSAANYLSASGYAKDPRKAVFNYNRAEWYVNKVMNKAEEFKNAAIYQPSNMPPMTDGHFMRPTTGKVTSEYGYRWGRLHAGIDIGKGGREEDVPIVAVAHGVVTRSYYSSSYGHTVILRHNIEGKQFETLYAHMTHRAVRDGQTVSKGQFLGNMGNTGRSTGPHLHFEIHEGVWTQNKKNSRNPVLYVPF
ncbi:peptidoglycan DD-metalloendopeptidase family protein [Bacillus alkalicellulosilyticus]|uniref:peptidoglycan DD-metalloendopeptidase family protein n=1 Tax=Alkalihalobacterium alkalicellulosilyticum TaxID=1912214 RepID=UPI0009976839|nr:peptidoglycan DD-metalloendopeptidase family protein [Bacillus alkalicellulosilyticus]